MKRVIWDQDVRGTPTFRFYRQGRLVRGFSGLGEDGLKNEIEKAMNMPNED